MFAMFATQVHPKRSAVIIAILLTLTILTVSGMDRTVAWGGPPGEGAGVSRDDPSPRDDHHWTPVIPDQTPKPGRTDRPWWEITTRDANRNRIEDSLESPEFLAVDHSGGGPDNGPRGAPIILSYGRPVTEQDLEALAELGIYGGYVVNAIDAISIGLRDRDLIPTLAGLDGVVMVEHPGMVRLHSHVATRAMKARGSGEYSPHSAWELANVTGYGINIAVVDTGIDAGHPSLAGKLVAGYDAITLWARTDGGDDPDDRNGHGTTCAGIATGTSKGDPELRYMGSAPGAGLIDVQIGTDIGAGPFENYIIPTEYYDSAIRGLEWVRDNANTAWSWVEPDHHGIDIMSLSWGITSHEMGGSDGSDPFSRLIDEVVQTGVVCVGAAGNDGPDNDGFSGMSASSLAIIVGATSDLRTVDRGDDIIASYSSRGPRRDDNDGYPYDELKPDVSAPGTNIWNTEPCVNTNMCYGDAEGRGYESRGSGTSYATPAVAGVVALILEANPGLSPALVKGILHLTSERRGPPSAPELDPFWNRDFGYGMVDAYEALRVTLELVEQDLDAIDVELQAHITDVGENMILTTGSEATHGAHPSTPWVIEPGDGNGETVIGGLAWARIGTVDRVEVSIDGGGWREVEYLNPATVDDAGTGDFIRWRYLVRGDHLAHTGDHTIHVRAVSGASHSIPHSRTFFAVAEDPDDDGMEAWKVAAVASLVLLILLVLVLVIVKKRGCASEGDPDEVVMASEVFPGDDPGNDLMHDQGNHLAVDSDNDKDVPARDLPEGKTGQTGNSEP